MSKVKIDKSRVAEVFVAHPDSNKIIILSDGTIFIEKHASYAATHKKEFKLTSVEISRGEDISETDIDADTDSKKPVKAPVVLTMENWKEGKYGDIKAFAESLGLAPTTPPAKGAKALIEEVESLLAPEA